MKDIYDLIIIGGGPAGISSGIYAARQRLNTLLVTKNFGGQIARKAVGIENYPGFKEISGLNLIKKFTQHLKKFNIEILQDSVVKVGKSGRMFSILTGTKKKTKAKTVIIASGADPRSLEVPGEKKFIGKGVSYCTACDAPLFAKKEVAVVGGGNSGFEAAIALSSWAKKVYILEYFPEVRADAKNQERVKKIKKVEVITSAVLKKVEGKEFISSVSFEDKKTKTLKKLPVEGVFVEIGSQPATSFVKGLVNFNKKDEIIIDPKTMQTKTPGLFAAGDVTDVIYKQVVIAAGEGTKAALSVSNYLQKI
jgi:alkyl hydroperoxide reductase subunit F